MTLTAFNRRRRELAVQQAGQVQAATLQVVAEPRLPEEIIPAKKPLSRMNKAELLAAAAERGVEVVETATKKEIIAALTAAEPADEQQEDTQPPNAQQSDDEGDGSGDQSETAENEQE